MTYDAYGNPKQWFKHEKEGSKLKYTLRFEKVNRLSKITDNDSGEEYEYEYNYNGIRTTKRVNGITHEYYLDGENIIAETRTSGDKTDKLKYYYDALGICGMEYNGDYYYYVKNIQGDITHVCKQEDSGISEVYAQYEYDAWGVRKVKKDVGGIADVNPYGYRGYYLDNETKLWYLNSRYYDSEVGRFLTPDSLDYLDPETLGGLNRYTYCGNNPVNYYDPSGHL